MSHLDPQPDNHRPALALRPPPSPSALALCPRPRTLSHSPLLFFFSMLSAHRQKRSKVAKAVAAAARVHKAAGEADYLKYLSKWKEEDERHAERLRAKNWGGYAMPINADTRRAEAQVRSIAAASAPLTLRPSAPPPLRPCAHPPLWPSARPLSLSPYPQPMPSPLPSPSFAVCRGPGIGSPHPKLQRVAASGCSMEHENRRPEG